MGGLQNHAQEFNQHMAGIGYKITVFTPRIPKESKPHEKIDGITIIRFPAIEIIPNYPIPKLWSPKFWKQLKKVISPLPSWGEGASPEARRVRGVIISRTRFFSTSLLALAVSKILRNNWLHIEHGSDYVHSGNSFTRAIAKLYDHTLGNLVLTSAHQVVANSEASARFVKKLSNRDSTVIYRGINIERPGKTPGATASAASPGVEERRIVITYAGRLINGKGIQDLIKAMQILSAGKTPGVSRRQSPGVEEALTLTIIGSGPEEANLKTLTQKLNLENRVKFIGEKSRAETIAHLKASRIFVNPSYTEGLPTNVIEALACGCYTIATDVGGTREIPGVHLIPPHNPQAIAEAIQDVIPHLMRDPENKSHQVNLTKFSWPTAIRKYYAILSSL